MTKDNRPTEPKANLSTIKGNAAVDEDGGIVHVEGLYGELVPADSLEAARALINDPVRIHHIVQQSYVAPDPFEDHPDERALALAPLLASENQSFGLSRLPAEFHRLSGSQRLDYVLDLPDPNQTVQALPAEEFVFLVKDLGLSDAGALLSMASPRQLQVLVDLDVWQSDEIDRLRFAHLLAVAMNAGADTTERFVASQEDGLLCHFISGSARVYESAEEAEEQLPEDWQQFIAPDGTMVVGMPMEDDAMGPIRALLDAVFRVDIKRGRRLLRATRWELRSSMQEDLYETRNKRLADHGFPPRSEALEVYKFVSPQQALEQANLLLAGESEGLDEVRPYIPQAQRSRTDLALSGLSGAPFLAKAVAACDVEQQARLQLGTVHLAYRIQAARAERPSETDELATWTRHAVLTANMGLEWLSEGVVERATALIKVTPLSEIFRVGHSLVVTQHHRALRLKRRIGGSTATVGRGLTPWLDGLCKPLPLLPQPADGLRLDQLIDPDNHISAYRPYGNRAEIAQSKRLLNGLEGSIEVLESLGGASLGELLETLRSALPDDRGQDLTLSSVLATAIAWTLLTGSPKVQALRVSEVAQVLAEAFEGPLGRRTIKKSLRSAMHRALLMNPNINDETVEAVEHLLNRTLDRLNDELGGVDPHSSLDARFIGTALAICD